ncbi:MAG TPA: YibE/F family protein, partial [Pseudodesulfovibrio sp.]|nr:YibE/F family protein [Pseudodesulfovibrio sp.]
MHAPSKTARDWLLVLIFIILSTGLYCLPTGFESTKDKDAVRCTGRITAVDDSHVQDLGMIRAGEQEITLDILDGPFRGKTFTANNQLLGQLDRDKLFKAGDTAYVILTVNSG